MRQVGLRLAGLHRLFFVSGIFAVIVLISGCVGQSKDFKEPKLEASQVMERAVRQICPQEPCECPKFSWDTEGSLEPQGAMWGHLTGTKYPELIVGATGCGETGKSNNSIMVFSPTMPEDLKESDWKLAYGESGYPVDQCEVVSPTGQSEVLLCASEGGIAQGVFGSTLLSIEYTDGQFTDTIVARFSDPIGTYLLEDMYESSRFEELRVQKNDVPNPVAEVDVRRAVKPIPDEYENLQEALDDGWEKPEPKLETDRYRWTGDEFQLIDE